MPHILQNIVVRQSNQRNSYKLPFTLIEMVVLLQYNRIYIFKNRQERTKMLSDIEIAQSAKIKPITEVAKQAGIDPDKLELYGNHL